MLEWIEGEPLARENALRGPALETYVASAVRALRAVHAIELPFWGALGGGPRFASFPECFDDLDRVAARSFGDALTTEHSLRELEAAGLVARWSQSKATANAKHG